MGSESNVEVFDGFLHSLAMSADDCSVEYCGWLGDIGDVFADPKLGKICLGWECDGCHCGIVFLRPAGWLKRIVNLDRSLRCFICPAAPSDDARLRHVGRAEADLSTDNFKLVMS